MKKTVKSDSPPDIMLFTPVSERRTYKEIATQIRQQIYSRTLKPGDKLPTEVELARRFKAGRISVREALRTLEQAGLIYIKKGSTGGSFVKAVDPSVAAASLSDLVWQGDINVKDLTEARLDYERLILQKVFDRITPEEMMALEKCVQDLEALIVENREGDYPPEPTLTNFHIMLAQATKNPVFPIILRVLMNVTVKVLKPGRLNMKRLERHASYHRTIYEALKRRDLGAALKTIEAHMMEVANESI
jgi:GntR family transcriptional regulator, transcriptional repressor for pyruvate dehydrogenase complex